jgi:hypothetical protein
MKVGLLYKEDEYDSTRIIAGALFDIKIPLSNDGLRNIKTNDVFEYFSFEDWGLGLSRKAQAAKLAACTVVYPPKIYFRNNLRTI